jgi:CRP/FNR family transcriptional regulator, nitrogen fixation regulation protein
MAPQASVSRSTSLAQDAIAARAILKNDVPPSAPLGAVQHFAQDREIFSEGNAAEYYYKIVSGVVRTCKFLVDGRRQIDAFYTAGDIFGFEPDLAHRFSAEAVTDCTMVAYRKGRSETLGGGDGPLSQELLSFAMGGMARAQAHSLLLGRRSALEKVAGFLMDWAQRSPDHHIVNLAMTRQDIADYLGLTIETVSRTLTQLERDRVIDLPSARLIRLRNPDTLEELAG